MELYDSFIHMVDVNIICCLPPIILFLILTEYFFKNKYATKGALKIVRWIIIIYTIITLLHFLIGMSLFSQEFAFNKRATGPYKIAYWVMFFSASILPFSLFEKKIATKFWYVLLVSFLMKVGVYFERFVIITTSMHRDYAPDGWANNPEYYIWRGYLSLILQSFILTLVFLGIAKIIEEKKMQ